MYQKFEIEKYTVCGLMVNSFYQTNGKAFIFWHNWLANLHGFAKERKKWSVYFFYILQLPHTVISNSEKLTHPNVECTVVCILVHNFHEYLYRLKKDFIATSMKLYCSEAEMFCHIRIRWGNVLWKVRIRIHNIANQ